MTENQQKLQAHFDKKAYWEKEFNNLHRRAKRIKQMMALKKPEEERLLKIDAAERLERINSEGLGALAD